MRKWCFYLFFICFTSAPLWAQPKDTVLANVGKAAITQDDFLERFELTPWPRSPKKQLPESFKKDFLYTLVAEKLWALKAKEEGLDTAEAIRMVFKPLEKMYVRDALYKIEIKDKAIVPEQENVKGYFRVRFLLNTDYLIAANEQEIGKLYEALKKGASFDSLFTIRGGSQRDTLQISYGLLEEAVEDAVYSLTPGQFSEPVYTPNGWCIFRLKESLEQPISQQDQKKVDQLVKKITTERVTARYYNAFFRNFFAQKKVDVNSHLFLSLTNKVISLLQFKKKSEAIGDSDAVFLLPIDIFQIKNQFTPDSLNAIFIKLDKNPVSFSSFLDDFAIEGFHTVEVQPRMVRSMINTVVKKYVEGELLAREGYRRGLQNLPEVKRYLNMWKDNYLAQYLKSRLKDTVSVSDEEARKYFNDQKEKLSSKGMVNIAEVLTDSLEVIEKVLEALKHDADIHDLARRYSQRPSAKEHNGESGFFSISQNGEIGRLAASMKIGDIFGPLKVPEGYTIFQVIGKKDDSLAKPENFEKIKGRLKNEIAGHKRYNSIVAYTVKLAAEYGVKIHDDLLKSTELINIPMFTYRLMGFGGRIPAVPLTAPEIEWVDPFLDYKANLP